MRFRCDRGHLAAALARADCSAPPALVDPRSCADNAAVQRPRRRREHHAESWRGPFDQTDIDGVVVAAADEFLRSVERVDEKIGVAVSGDSADGDLLFGNDWHARSRARQCGEDDKLGRSVGFSDGRRISFGLNLEAATDNCPNRFAGFARSLG